MRQILKRVCCASYRYGVVYIYSRYHLGHILNGMKLLNEGAEVGVREGAFSEAILKIWEGRRLYSIDPWQEYSEKEYDDTSNAGREQQENLYRAAVEKLRPFADRSVVVRSTSEKAVNGFSDGQLDFVYIDAQHHYEAVKMDIALWCRKVRRGGILAGHDYLDGELPQGLFGVKSAVDEFARNTGRRLIISAEEDWKSWFVFV